MKKIIRLTESDLINLVNRVLQEQSVAGAPNMGVISKPKTKSIGGGNNFKAEANVEDDMVMQFPVVEFWYGNQGVEMFFKDVTKGNGNKILKVYNFEGPIFDELGNKKIYRDSVFINVNLDNWKNIAKKNNIPVSEVTE